MTEIEPEAAPKRRSSVLGITAVIVVVLGLLPTVAVTIIGFLPDMMTVFWLLLVVFPFTLFVGFIGLILGIIALILDIRAQRKLVWPIIAVVLGLVATLGPMSFLLGWWS